MQKLITSLFESIWVSNLIGGLFEGRGSWVNFSFLRDMITKLGPQRITVKILMQAGLLLAVSQEFPMLATATDSFQCSVQFELAVSDGILKCGRIDQLNLSS